MAAPAAVLAANGPSGRSAMSGSALIQIDASSKRSARSGISKTFRRSFAVSEAIGIQLVGHCDVARAEPTRTAAMTKQDNATRVLWSEQVTD